MRFLLTVAAVVFLILVVRLMILVRHGRRLARSVLKNEATDGSVEAIFAAWLQGEPGRLRQRDIFVRVLTGMGESRAWCADHLIRCVTRSWAPGGPPFGQVLAEELDRRITWDDPGSDALKTESQRRAKEALMKIKADLIALDTDNSRAAAET
jgi:hypothetical protein